MGSAFSEDTAERESAAALSALARARRKADPDGALLDVLGAMKMRDDDADTGACDRARDDVGRKVLAGAHALDRNERECGKETF